MKKHYREIDILKGVAIAMVILGHSIIVYPINLNVQYPWCGYLHNMMSSVHMPLFFAISGFCFGFYDWKSFLSKKCKRLMIPYVVFFVMGVLVDNLFPDYVNSSSSYKAALLQMITGKGNWFLFTLFVIFLVFPLIMKLFETQSRALIVICAFGTLQFFSFWPSIFRIDRVVKYIFFFSVGYCFKLLSIRAPDTRNKLITSVKKVPIWFASLALWLPLVFILYRWDDGAYVPYTFISIITAFLGMINVLSFAMIISQFRFSKLFEETGKVSLQLFLLNGYFLTITRTVTIRVLHITSPVLIIALNMIMMYFISFAFIHYVIKRVKVFRILTGLV